ncbi:MAG: hypothetical protein F6J90_28730 [Moorea sp. SIOASIH]|uniref:hypothetical protein n=1 Tax=Moorena sp. SIOASIH TaxID=2607817 RepID=UPI0013BD69E5|nr:hypothetical protein [Moorena sp. SIOASIH]NEO40110.1 hypothetical protein [Moorena sp. SIOASIH]
MFLTWINLIVTGMVIVYGDPILLELDQISAQLLLIRDLLRASLILTDQSKRSRPSQKVNHCLPSSY